MERFALHPVPVVGDDDVRRLRAVLPVNIDVYLGSLRRNAVINEIRDSSAAFVSEVSETFDKALGSGRSLDLLHATLA
jgi:hypothetical protein